MSAPTIFLLALLALCAAELVRLAVLAVRDYRWEQDCKRRVAIRNARLAREAAQS